MFDALIHKYLGIPYRLHIHSYRRIKKARSTVVFLHGIGNSGAAWDDITKHMPSDMNIIVIDLLGFGKSPRPAWAKYRAPEQARAVASTLLSLGLTKRVTIIGHSLGALTAVEVAKKYPILVRSLVLCSPPFYTRNISKPTLIPKSDEVLLKIYNIVRQQPDRFVKISNFAKRYGLVHPTFNVTEENVDTYMAVLESMIINQTSFEDAKRLKVPTQILRGTFDPFIVMANIRQLERSNKNITVKTVVAGHEIRGVFLDAVIKELRRIVAAK